MLSNMPKERIKLLNVFSEVQIKIHSPCWKLWLAELNPVCGPFSNLDMTYGWAQSLTRMGGAGKMTRIQTFKSFETRKWKGVKREHSTAVPWSPDLLRGQGSTHETFQQPEVLKRNSFTVYSGETKPDDPTGDNFSNSAAASRSKEDADWILYWRRTAFSDKLQLIWTRCTCAFHLLQGKHLSQFSTINVFVV